MATRMLIDAAHPEETRVVVVRGTRLEEFDIESATKQQLKGNIYLAKVTRVEPSLQAAFVDYGGNRHGFLPFSEIHPDYYQIPIEDRQALLEQEAFEGAAEVAEEEAEAERSAQAEANEDEDEEADAEDLDTEDDLNGVEDVTDDGDEKDVSAEADGGEPEADAGDTDDPEDAEGEADLAAEEADLDEGEIDDADDGEPKPRGRNVVAVGGDELDEVARPRRRPQRRYKVQEVIKRRQILLVQVVKEERGNKGAALTTYLSLAGRYCVLMPNTARGGGVSRKITSQSDRKKLKGVIDGLKVPAGMGLIVRTAGQSRSKAEIKRDYEYLLRLWDSVRELTLESTAPSLTYEEANLIKRSIRDLYSKEIDEVLVEGEEGYKAAKSFMKMLMPSHAKRVQPYADRIPLFHRYQVEQQFDSMHSPTVQLKSGGYIVISPTEALVAIDVNSGGSTRERNIEETAYRTNLEAAEEVARQLRLRDLAGLVVIDFIDMDESRNARNVERRLKEKLKSDRARIQVGRISPFGLLEMSRQRLRPSLIEASTEVCAHCEGTGVVRSIESSALHVLRAIEEEGIRGRAAEILIHVATPVALYLLNQKRDGVLLLEERFKMRIGIGADESLVPPDYRLERVRTHSGEVEEIEAVSEVIIVEADDSDSDEDTQPKKRRRRGKRGGRRRRGKTESAESTETATDEAKSDEDKEATPDEQPAAQEADSADEAVDADSEAKDSGVAEEKPRRRRRRRRSRKPAAETPVEAEAQEVTEATTDETAAPETEAAADAESDQPVTEDAPVETVEAEDGDQESPTEAEAPTEPEAEEADAPEPADEPAEAEAEAEAVTEAEAEPEAEPEPEPTLAADADIGVAEVAEPATEIATPQIVATEPAPDDGTNAAEEDAPKSRRKGWWQRG